ncbi:hypothetical protein E3N88_01336 [Mikania micrantha]|uniref:Uncharacterized protein n=1 Tax=Mikania micrantha TaxID=192012 RepID=A0A5N6Q3D7_9ASTR|nr:hypothetical protein E3N88_01336 [Mikania micrantha]
MYLNLTVISYDLTKLYELTSFVLMFSKLKLLQAIKDNGEDALTALAITPLEAIVEEIEAQELRSKPSRPPPLITTYLFLNQDHEPEIPGAS